MTRPLYDTKDGIKNHYLARGLEGLYQLKNDRHEAGYDRRERLTDFCILGRWMTDTCGNFSKIISDPRMDYLVPADVDDVPPVMDREEAYKYVKTTACGANSQIPPPDIVCEQCGVRWHLGNAHDAVEKNGDVVVDCSPFVGVHLETFEKSLRSNRRLNKLFGEFLRNDRYIDLEPAPGYTFAKNPKGWMGKKELGSGYRLQEGDQIHVTYFYWRHKSCDRQLIIRREAEDMVKIFTIAGFKEVDLTPIQNQYCQRDQCPPWFRARTKELGELVIGWRKRVISIQWPELAEKGTINIEKLFESEDVTKGKDFIHAWGDKKATDYLFALRIASENQ